MDMQTNTTSHGVEMSLKNIARQRHRRAIAQINKVQTAADIDALAMAARNIEAASDAVVALAQRIWKIKPTEGLKL